MLTIKADKVSSIKKEFNELFPFLKLEFFRQNHAVRGGSPRQQLVKEDFILKPLHKENKTMIINEHMPVSAVEQLFNEQFGVSVQVFRRSGNLWLETTMTDNWTLKRQNDTGQELSAYTRH
jgi:hypothetical protein